MVFRLHSRDDILRVVEKTTDFPHHSARLLSLPLKIRRAPFKDKRSILSMERSDEDSVKFQVGATRGPRRCVAWNRNLMSEKGQTSGFERSEWPQGKA